ncbi:MAG TPA: M28 family peptidase [Thermomicrobiales bacterium]|nr:M28 family peptidase [Thermomicrobiales bacterium]
MALDEILRDLSVDDAWAHIERITTQIPSRLAGSDNSRHMAEYARDAFQEAGLESRLHEFRGLVSFPEPAAVRVLAPEAYEIAANTLGHSASTEGLEGELVYVGSGAERDYEGKEVRGKITLSELSYAPARHEKAYVAWRRGSTAQIMMNWGDETNTAVPFGSIKSAWGNPTPETLAAEMPDLPCVGIARTEGLRLKALCERGPVRVWLRARADNGWRPLTMTSAESGAAPDRQFLLLGGHMDSWPGPQATDNAAGDACMMELARVFHRHRDELRRGLVVGLWMGHETGTMISSSRFADVNWDRLRRSCVAYLQIDQPAIAGSSTWHVHSTDDIQDYAVRTAREVVGAMPVSWHRQQKNGDSSFFGVGLPSLAGEMTFTDEEIRRTALATLGWWHHSLENTLDKVDKGRLALHLRVYARWLWGLLTDPLLPYSYRPLAARFVARLDELAALDVPDIDLAGAAVRAREFQALADRLDARCAAWRERADGDEAAADLLNEAMMRLSRILVPVASTVVGPYGQDRYGHAWQTQMIPALALYPALAAAPRDSEAYQTGWVAAVRARNRVADALEEASAVARAALERLGDEGTARG